MKLYVVFHVEDCVGSFFQDVFSTQEKAEKWIETQNEHPASECFIKEYELK